LDLWGQRKIDAPQRAQFLTARARFLACLALFLCNIEKTHGTHFFHYNFASEKTHMMRVYYIANSYDGAYFVLTDDLQEYIQRMAAYVLNLEKSGKTNHYSFGSIEMTEQEYEKYQLEASALESGRIKAKEEALLTKSEEEVELIEDELSDLEEHNDSERHLEIVEEKKIERGHLRLV
jgi:hypothetical protein